jgi:hypothetical protein
MTLLAIDPGETVGWAIYDGTQKIDGGQTDWGDFTKHLAASFKVVALDQYDEVPVSDAEIETRLRGDFMGVTEIVMEDFVIYPPNVGPGPPPPWDEVITARLIGAIQVLADLAGVPVHYQGAKIKSDALASAAAEDFSRPLHENRHENDATMHAVHFIARRLVTKS